MATIQKRGKSYSIRVSCGYDTARRQIVRSMTWRPEDGMTEAQAEREARRQGKTVIRLDTWEGNLPANRLYPSLGYRYAGQAEFFFMGFVRENLNCYEKALWIRWGARSSAFC